MYFLRGGELIIMADEKRLIDANALIKEANAEGAYGYVDIKQIADAPTVDAVEVVRCKQCVSHNLCKFEQFQGLDGFCSYGERKNNG